MTTHLISLAGLLLMLSAPAFAETPPPAQPAAQTTPVQSAQAPANTQAQLFAWQRVGAPLGLAG